KMFQLTHYEILKILRQRGNWFALAFWIFVSSLLFFYLLKDYTFQKQLAVAQMGVTQGVVKPFWGWMLFVLYIGAPMLTILNLGLEHSQKSYHFWILHRFPVSQYIFPKLLGLLTVQTLGLLLILAIPLSLFSVTTIDFGLLCSGFVTVWCMMFFMVSLSLALYVATLNAFFSLMLTYSCVLIFSIMPGFSTFPKLTQWLNYVSPLQHAHGLMNGRLYVTDVFYFVFIITILIAFCLSKMQKRFRKLDY
ncbi:MAG TPA: hypothetical protein VFP93_01025, partial [Gammaproteobacteria bacterium]|nr:hypothetical protein [Gammaproteobacteria bacterium]